MRGGLRGDQEGDAEAPSVFRLNAARFSGM